MDTFLTVDAQGRVGAYFQGHISAAGIDMIAGYSGSPPDDRKITWHADTITGARIAEIFGFKSTDDATATLRAYGRTGIGVGEVNLYGESGNGLHSATVKARGNELSGDVQIGADGTFKELLKTGPKSDWLFVSQGPSGLGRTELVGPIFASMAVDIAAGAGQQITVSNLPDISWATSAVTFGNFSDGGYAAQFGIRVDYPSSTSVRFTFLNMGPNPGRCNYAAYIIATTETVYT